MMDFLNLEYFTDPSLKERVNTLLKERETKFEVNKMVQQMKTQDLNKR